MISNPQVSGLSDYADSALERLLRAARSQQGVGGDVAPASHGTHTRSSETNDIAAETPVSPPRVRDRVKSDDGKKHRNVDTNTTNRKKNNHSQDGRAERGATLATHGDSKTSAHADAAAPSPRSLLDVMQRIRTGRGSSEEVKEETDTSNATGVVDAPRRTSRRDDLPVNRAHPNERTQDHTAQHHETQPKNSTTALSRAPAVDCATSTSQTTTTTASTAAAAQAAKAAVASACEPVETQFVADANLGVGADNLPELPELVHPRLRHPLTQVMHISQLTRIQQLSWHAMCDPDTDVLLRSETGSGKTLAYALPLMHTLLTRCDVAPMRREDGTRVIVMCPTRELVLQVTDTLTVLLRNAPFLTVGGIYGGENRHKEKARLRRGVPVLVGTPGRLLDHLRATAAFDVSAVSAVVMDEADRLLDLGFEASIRDIMTALTTPPGVRGRGTAPSHRSSSVGDARVNSSPRLHSPVHVREDGGSSIGCVVAAGEDRLKRILVSATITAAVERLSHFALRPRRARVGETEDNFAIPATLRQHFVSVPVKHRLAVLLSFLRAQLDAGARRIVVFVATADTAEFLYYLVSSLTLPAAWGGRGGRRVTTVNSTSPDSLDAAAATAGRRSTPAQRARRMTELANRHLTDDSGSSREIVTFDEDEDEEDAKGENDARAAADDPTGTASSARGDSARLLDGNVFTLHGNMSQVDRGAVYRAFQSLDGGAAVLFCTDVAARGLDLPAVDWIVHYDPPTEPACYIHRVGRTARIGRSGDSILFLAPHEVGYVNYIHHFIHTHGSPATSTATIKNNSSSSTGDLAGMAERRYETFLFYLTKLDPRSNHRWRDCTATLERAISRAVMHHRPAHHGKDGGASASAASESVRGARAGRLSRGGGTESLERLALFAYQSHLRAYAAMSRTLKRLFFPSEALHLGHVAQSFGIDEGPREVQRRLRGVIMADRALARADDAHAGRLSRQAHRSEKKGNAAGSDGAVRDGGETEDADEEAEANTRVAHVGRDDGTAVRKRGRVELAHADRYHSSVAQKQRKLTRDWAERRMREEGATTAPRHNSEFAA